MKNKVKKVLDKVETKLDETKDKIESTLEKAKEKIKAKVNQNKKVLEQIDYYSNLPKDTLIVRFADDYKTITLEKELEVSFLTNKGYDSITIPKGFVSDGFSSKVFRFIVPKYSRGLRAVILHDYLCKEFHKGEYTRKYADKSFLQALLNDKYPTFKAYFIYLCVRLYAKIKGYK
jgi:hypothetical protein